MKVFDGDEGRLLDNYGIPPTRDITQFVELDKALAKGDLSKQVLKEVPKQFCAYMKQIGYSPFPQE